LEAVRARDAHETRSDSPQAAQSPGDAYPGSRARDASDTSLPLTAVLRPAHTHATIRLLGCISLSSVRPREEHPRGAERREYPALREAGVPMTPAEEARFIALWQQGATYRAIAQSLDCALDTVGSRAYTLVRQGKIQARPKGGNYPMQQRRRRQEETPAPQVLPATPAMTFVAVPEIQEMLSLVQDLPVRVIALEQTRVAPALPAPPAAPAPLVAERKDIQQWTVRLSKALIEHLKAVAYTRRMPPSQLVEELVWKALMDRPPLPS
jgi:hypothetical protein